MIKSELIQKIAATNQHLYHRDIEPTAQKNVAKTRTSENRRTAVAFSIEHLSG